MCLLDICISSLEKCYSKSLSNFVLSCMSLLLNYKSSLYMLNKSLIRYVILQIFSPILWADFLHFSGIVHGTTFLTLRCPIWSIFTFINCAFDIACRKPLLNPRFKDLLLFIFQEFHNFSSFI